MKLRPIIIIVCTLTLALSCRSRLKPKLYQIIDESRLKLEYMDSYYMDGFTLSTSPNADPLSGGAGKVLITNQRKTDPGREEIRTGLISAVGQINYRIYVDLPQNITAGTLDMNNRSICRVIGMYELDDRIKHYVCREGYLKIDTVKTSRFHAQLYGKYYNFENDSLIFEGDLNVKRKK